MSKQGLCVVCGSPAVFFQSTAGDPSSALAYCGSHVPPGFAAAIGATPGDPVSFELALLQRKLAEVEGRPDLDPAIVAVLRDRMAQLRPNAGE
jgi:hypothetical protein